MKLSENTIQVLKNFSGINQNIVFRPGNVLKTMSDQRNIMSTAHIEEEFPAEVGIYDLNEFLGVLNLVENPEITFKDSYALIADNSGLSKIKYFYSSTEILTSPSKDLIMPNCDVEFELSNSILSKLQRAASALGHDELVISGKNDLITLTVTNVDNITSNSFALEIPGSFDETAKFNFVLNINNLKLLPGDYIVNISKKLISHLVNKDQNVEYWVALEKNSTYHD